jgi:hypothetical protein
LQPSGLRWKERYARARQRYENSERHAYRQLRTAARSDDPKSFYAALCRWVDRQSLYEHSSGSEALAACSGDAQLHAAITQLEATLFSNQQKDPAIVTLVTARIDAIRRRKQPKRSSSQFRLQPLNP